jgi:hypothetical protein
MQQVFGGCSHMIVAVLVSRVGDPIIRVFMCHYHHTSPFILVNWQQRMAGITPVEER